MPLSLKLLILTILMMRRGSFTTLSVNEYDIYLVICILVHPIFHDRESWHIDSEMVHRTVSSAAYFIMYGVLSAVIISSQEGAVLCSSFNTY